VITPGGQPDPRWGGSLMHLLSPRPRDSLAAFSLRLDQANGLPAGATLRTMRSHGTGLDSLATPGALLSASTFDLTRLALLCLISLESCVALTACELSAALFGGAPTSSRSLGARQGWAVCSLCIASGEVPLELHFKYIDACSQHQIRLSTSCRCGSLIRLFSGQEPFVCADVWCARPYATLPTIAARRGEFRIAAAHTAVCRDLLALTATATPISDGSGRRGLRHLLLLRPRTDKRRRLLDQCKGSAPTTVDLIVRVLRFTSSSVADWLLAMDSERGAVVPAQRAYTRCPNASCTSNALERNLPEGRFRTCGECGTRHTRTRVVFAFDAVAGYPAWRSVRNARRLETLRTAVTNACTEIARTRNRFTATAVFERAGVPRSFAYYSDRAGLLAIVRRFEGLRRAA
jgi:hypothetical protein